MSETVDSGHQMPPAPAQNKSKFSHTFNLLTQYLKQNGTFGDLSLGMGGCSSASETMNLFPPAAANNSSQPRVPKKSAESAAAQMTIFYAGQVMVLDDFPAEKAMEIMMMLAAGQTSSTQQHPNPNPNLTQHLNINNKQSLRLHPPVVSADLPIARKASLARFLEKRKERINANAPYQSDYNHGITPGPSKHGLIGPE